MATRGDPLTVRQLECLRGKWDRKLDKIIASEMGISQRAVEEHLRSARDRLGATSSVEAARIAAEVHGWVDSVNPNRGPTQLPDPNQVIPIISSTTEGDVSPKNAVRDVEWMIDTRDAFYVGSPLRKRGERSNDLTHTARLIWIIAITVGIPAAIVLVRAMTESLGHVIKDVVRLAS